MDAKSGFVLFQFFLASVNSGGSGRNVPCPWNVASAIPRSRSCCVSLTISTFVLHPQYEWQAVKMLSGRINTCNPRIGGGEAETRMRSGSGCTEDVWFFLRHGRE